MFAKITRLNVTFFRPKYVPQQLDEQEKVVPGTGTTEQVEVTKFKRNGLEIPEESKNLLSSKELSHLIEELTVAENEEKKQNYSSKFSEHLEELNRLNENFEFLNISKEDLEIFSALASQLKRKAKAKLKKEGH